MTIELKDMENIAHLARLDLSAGEKQEVLNSIVSILELIDQMQAVDTTGVEPLSHAFEASQRLREDLVTEHDQRSTLLALAPKGGSNIEHGLYLVPKVLEQRFDTMPEQLYERLLPAVSEPEAAETQPDCLARPEQPFDSDTVDKFKRRHSLDTPQSC